MKVEERFLKYVSVWTTSDEESKTTPSAERELNLARLLVDEMKRLGICNARVDEHGYVYGSIPATAGMENVPALGLIAHMDTAPEFSGKNVNPQIIRNYDGEDVLLGTSGKVLSVSEFPLLKEMKGRTLITTDGTTLLGADDKAGIAEILTAVEQMIKEEIPHGKICVGFTPDEEIGSGADLLDLKAFGADCAFTVDGDQEGQIQFENFNAASATFTVHGVNVHTGSAKDIMVNSQQVAMDIHARLPETDRPEHTEGYEGFYHLMSFQGNVEHTVTKYLIRDFDAQNMERRVEFLNQIVDEMNEKYGAGTVELKVEESYRNMREKIEPCMWLVDTAVKACEMAGVPVDQSPIRGGTDGARLSYRGLPCPNLGTGGHAFHGCFEHITVEGMEKVVEIVKNIIRMFPECR